MARSRQETRRSGALRSGAVRRHRHPGAELGGPGRRSSASRTRSTRTTRTGSRRWRWSGRTSSTRRRTPSSSSASAELFLARRDGQVVGRIAAVDDPRYNEFHGTQPGFFGMFECDRRRRRGPRPLRRGRALGEGAGLRRRCWGRSTSPPTTSARVLVEGFDAPPAVMMAYNPRYYARSHRGVRLHQGEGPVGLGAVLVRPASGEGGRASRRRSASARASSSARSDEGLRQRGQADQGHLQRGVGEELGLRPHDRRTSSTTWPRR